MSRIWAAPVDSSVDAGCDVELPRWLKLAGAGVALATFCGYDDADHFLVRVDGEEQSRPAASTLALRDGDLGCRVVVAYEGGDVRRPVVMGRFQMRGRGASDVHRIDADRVRVEAGGRIELRCGEASIVLTRAGKVLINGAYVSSRSKGANRIKGAHVDIN